MKIIELYEEELPQEFDEAIKLIKRDCKSFLAQRGEGLLYRGVQKGLGKNIKTFSKKVPRTDRKPKNTLRSTHQELDDWFNDNFGFRARSAAVFVTGDLRDARSYGAAYAIFPIGDFEFLWSPNIGDLFIALGNPENMESTLKNAEYKKTDLADAIESGHEIMLSCKEYYALHIKEYSEDVLHIKNAL